MSSLAQDERNQKTWSKASSRRELDNVGPFSDPGERAAYVQVSERVRGKPILDLGVGTGRTVPLLTSLSSDYRALDYSPAMVEATRAKYPRVRVQIGDARDLTGYPEHHFGLVNFAFNGIDAVSHVDRARVFRAVRRALAPKGIFIFSTLNIDGPSYRERPWRIRIWPSSGVRGTIAQLVRQVTRMPFDVVNWLIINQTTEIGDGYAVAPLSAHHYRILAHYTPLGRQLAELRDEGFDPDVLVFDSRDGQPVLPSDDTADIDWFHFLAQAP
jgi:SAM-dependent methyltransferase